MYRLSEPYRDMEMTRRFPAADDDTGQYRHSDFIAADMYLDRY